MTGAGGAELGLDHHDVDAATQRVHELLSPTPLVRSAALSRRTGAELFLKLDNTQVTGSFKARGAVHKLSCLSAEARAKGVVAASSGNHGKALAWAAKRFDTRVEVYVPGVADADKVAQIKALGALVHRVGNDCTEAEAHARAVAAQRGCVYVSPYNDLEVIAGQGSLGAELVEQCAGGREGPAEDAGFDAIYIALGGGGLAAGVGTVVHHPWPHTKIVGASPSASPALHRCLERGQIVDVDCADTLSDGTAGGVEAGAVSFALAQRELARSVLVSEAEIAAAMRVAMLEAHQVIEGAAGVALAACLREAALLAGQRVCVVLCGGNVSAQTLASVLS